MKLETTLLVIALAVGSPAVAGCAGSTAVVATAPSPRLVWIADGIWIVEDYPYPVYYHDGFYWRFTDGVWYRSDWYADGFVRVTGAPAVIVHVHRPHRYTRYRAPRGVDVRPIPHRRDHRERAKPRPKVRDHRKKR